MLVLFPSTVADALLTFVSITSVCPAAWFAALSFVSYSVVFEGTKSSFVELILIVIGSFRRVYPGDVSNSVITYSSASSPLMISVPSAAGENCVPFASSVFLLSLPVT